MEDDVLSKEQKSALDVVAQAFGWDRMSLYDVALLAWCAFQYYVVRLGRAHGD
jgi:hypothetical protein